MARFTKYPGPAAAEVARARSTTDYTQAQAAEICLVSVRTYAAYEAGDSEMHPLIWKHFKEQCAAAPQVSPKQRKFA